MFEFGRELRKLFGAGADKFGPDVSLLELLNLTMLQGQARASDLSAGRANSKDPFGQSIEAAMCWRELARRSGDAGAMRKAASSAEYAGKVAKTPNQAAAAALEQALVCLTGVELFCADELVESAETLIQEGVTGASGDVFLTARFDLAAAKISGRKALRTGVFDDALTAAALYDKVIKVLDSLVRSRNRPQTRTLAAEARLGRSSLLAAVGVQMKSADILEPVTRDLQTLLNHLDMNYEPVTYGRVHELLGSIRAQLGDMTGDQDLVAKAVHDLADLESQIPKDHSPLDWTRQRQSLALALQALGEITGRDEPFSQALEIFEDALVTLDVAHLALKTTLSNNRGICLARRAELSRDLGVLFQAETTFKAELSQIRAQRDPVAWAILQANLGRLYEARGSLTGDFVEREAAAYAFEAAWEVFEEQGLNALRDIAEAGMMRVRQARSSPGLGPLSLN